MVEVVDSTILPVSSVSVCSRAQALRAVHTTAKHLQAPSRGTVVSETSRNKRHLLQQHRNS